MNRPWMNSLFQTKCNFVICDCLGNTAQCFFLQGLTALWFWHVLIRTWHSPWLQWLLKMSRWKPRERMSKQKSKQKSKWNTRLPPVKTKGVSVFCKCGMLCDHCCLPPGNGVCKREGQGHGRVWWGTFGKVFYTHQNFSREPSWVGVRPDEPGSMDVGQVS